MKNTSSAHKAGQLLGACSFSLGVAESCTGGLLAARLTALPGASAFFAGGVVAYANRIKSGLLGVPESVLKREGSVSESVAKHMAKGVCKVLATDVALAITGVAGPAGGTASKPVGTVCIGLNAPGSVRSARFQFSGTRRSIREAACRAALKMLVETLEKTCVSAPNRAGCKSGARTRRKAGF